METYDQMFKEYTRSRGYTQDDFRIDTKEKALEIMNEYHNIDREHGAERMLVGLYLYIKKCIYDYGGWYIQSNNKDDRDGKVAELIACCVIALMEAINKYDPEIYLPTTYFDYYFHGAIIRKIEADIAKTEIRSHSDGVRQVNKSIQYMELNGNSNWSTSDIAFHANMTVRTAENRLQLKNIQEAKSIEEHFDEVGGIESKQPSVESIVLNNIRDENINQILSELEPMERDMVRLACGFETGKKESMASIAKYLQRHYNVTKTGDQVRYLLSKIYKRLSAHKKLRGYQEDAVRKKRAALNKTRNNRAIPEETLQEHEDALLEDDAPAAKENTPIRLEFGKQKKNKKKS